MPAPTYAFELKNPDGTVAMSTDGFGLMIADIFDVSPGATSSRRYPDLDWHNNIYAQGLSNLTGAAYPRALLSHAFVNITVTVDASNVPTIHWAPHNVKSAPLGNEDTSDWTQINYTTYKFNGLYNGGVSTPDIRIIVMAG